MIGVASPHKNSKERPLYKAYFKTVIANWTNVVKEFNNLPELYVAGHAVSPEGIAWVNFWWARASFIKTRVEPEFENSRFYYETWLSIESKSYYPYTIQSTNYSVDNKISSTVEDENANNEGMRGGRFRNISAHVMSLCLPEWKIGTTFTFAEIINAPIIYRVF